MRYVFIDTNVFLNFYTFNQDHLDKLDNLIDLIRRKKINLILPKQIVDEVNRNRENKLRETLKSLESFQMKLSIPSTCHDMLEMKEIQGTIGLLKEQTNKLKIKLLDQIKMRSLSADKLIYSIFKINRIIEISERLLRKAKLRFDLGNPPGKKGSYGDTINWECILENVPKKTDLYFIGGDDDYISDIDKNDFSGFLREEWKSKKKSKLLYYGLISQFLRDNFPQAKITKKDIGEEKKAVYDSQAHTSATITSSGWHTVPMEGWHTVSAEGWPPSITIDPEYFKKHKSVWTNIISSSDPHDSIITSTDSFYNPPENYQEHHDGEEEKKKEENS